MELKSLHYFYRNSSNTIRSPKATFLKYKINNVYTEISYEESTRKINSISSYLLSIGLEKGDRVAFIIENSPEYIFFDQACMQIGLINASIYPTLTESEVEYILKDSGSKAIIVGTPFLLKRILKIDANGTDLMKIITVFDLTEANSKTISLKDVIAKGDALYPELKNKIESILESVKPSDLATLIYTSGTTGVPKGVMLSHMNFMSNCVAAKTQVNTINENDVFLSFLPLCHVYERLATYYLSTYVGIFQNVMFIVSTVCVNIVHLL